MSKHIFRLMAITFILSVAVFGCKKDDDLPEVPPSDNPGEVITKLMLTFTDSADAANQRVFIFSDPDGEGGNAPVTFDNIDLTANSTWYVNINLVNESNPSDIEDITAEIVEEDDEHLFCFNDSGVNIAIERTDSDGTYEVGLESTWRVGAAGSGTVTVVLKHQPDVKDGTCAPGDTDIEIQFPTTIN